MAIPIIGVLCESIELFDDFQNSNSMTQCLRLHTPNDLIGINFTFFIRLDGWKELDEGLLNAVMVQEQLRGMGATKKEKMNMVMLMKRHQMKMTIKKAIEKYGNE